MNYLEILEAAWQDHLKPKGPDAPTVISLFAGGGGSSLGYSMAGYRELLAVERDDNAVATFKLNFTDVPVYHGDIAKLSVDECIKLAGLTEPGQLDLLDGSPPCFPAGIDILTEQSKMPIEFITAGVKVLTHAGKYRKVLDVFKKNYRGQLYTISLKYGRKPITCTSEHPFFARKRVELRRDTKTKKNSSRYKSYLDPEWIPANQLKVGDVICEPHINDAVSLDIPLIIEKQRINIAGVSGTEEFEMKLFERECNLDWQTNEMAWVLGFYLAEGHTRGRNPTLYKNGPCRREVIFSIADYETVEIANKLSDLGFNPSAQKHSKGSSRITVTSIDFWALCQVVGKYADGKFIPAAFHSQSIEWQKHFLDGYFSGDGYYKKNKKNVKLRKATTVSWDIAIGISRMIAKVYQIVAGIEILYPAGIAEIEGRTVTVKEAYAISYRLSESKRVRPGFVDNYGAWIPITDINITNEDNLEVYNLEVDEDNSYTANNYSVHNCQGFSTAGKRILNDPRNQLFREYVRLLRGLQPKVFVMENVSGLVKGKMKLVFAEIMRELKASGYQVKCKLMNAKYFYVPQSRERLIFIGIRNDLGIEGSYPKAESKPIVLKEAIPDIAFITLGMHGSYQGRIVNAALEPCPTLCKTGLPSYKYAVTELGKPPPMPSLLKKMRWQNTKTGSNHKDRFSLNRLAWNKPCVTIQKTVTGSGGVMHPDEPRELYESELKRIGSYPDSFCFVGKWEDILNRIGNSVPPLFMRSIANHIRQQILT